GTGRYYGAAAPASTRRRSDGLVAAIGEQTAHDQTASQRQPSVGAHAAITVPATLGGEGERGAAAVAEPAPVHAGAPVGQRTAFGGLSAVGGCDRALHTVSCVNTRKRARKFRAPIVSTVAGRG